MERVEEATTSKGLYGEDRGAGGKFRKPTLRKPPPTPYARPLAQPRQRSNDGGGWLSKLVNPATRLISGGASRLFPSFFSNPVSTTDVEESPEPEQDAGNENREQLCETQVSRLTEGQFPSEACTSKPGCDMDERDGDKLGDSSEDSGFSEIEQMMKEKVFSRDDFDRLTEILHSRISDRSDGLTEWAPKNPIMTTGTVVTGGSVALGDLRKSDIRNQSANFCETSRVPFEEKQVARSNLVTGAMSTPAPCIRDQVCASPIELAKAYMGARTLESGLGSESVMLRDERTTLPSAGFTLKSSITSPSPKSPICWPGAVVQDQLAYHTPQTQRGRIGLHNLPRTPYSRPFHTRSTSKLQDRGNKSINITPNQSKQSHTPIFGGSQVTRTRSSDDEFGSVGPVRRIRHKLVGASSSKGANSYHRSNASPFRPEGSGVQEGFSPIFKQIQEPGPSTSNSIKFHPVDRNTVGSSVGVSAVHPQSSETARKILEHLDRTTPTPRKITEELKMATSWRKSTSSQIPTRVLNGQLNETHVEGSETERSNHTIQQFSQGNEVTGSSLSKFQFGQRKNDEASDRVNPITSATSVVSSSTSLEGDGMCFNARSFKDFTATHNTDKVTEKQSDVPQSENKKSLPLENHVDVRDVSKLPYKDTPLEVVNRHKKPPAHTFGNKPALTSISISRPDPKRTVSFDNGSGFTFPVSAASGNLSEPPTPSVMPSSLTVGSPQAQERPIVPPHNLGSKTDEPSFSFGSKTANHALVFSFPSTSSSTPANGSTPQFNFGSDKVARLSFRSERKVAPSQSNCAGRRYRI